jgi:hypothetical protein
MKRLIYQQLRIHTKLLKIKYMFVLVFDARMFVLVFNARMFVLVFNARMFVLVCTNRKQTVEGLKSICAIHK